MIYHLVTIKKIEVLSEICHMYNVGAAKILFANGQCHLKLSKFAFSSNSQTVICNSKEKLGMTLNQVVGVIFSSDYSVCYIPYLSSQVQHTVKFFVSVLPTR